ncbi:MAG: hypothetical protein ABL967_02390 [Bryobacteraceae bacterium]
MPDTFLKARLQALHAAQNPDGGWGYFPGKESWLEPTTYAALALHGDPASDRAWKLILGWQLPDGSWRPSAAVNQPSWATSLCVQIAAARGEFGEPFQKGVNWLLNTSGVDQDLWSRFLVAFGFAKAEGSASGKGWSWKLNNSSWVEPTTHALTALRKAAPKVSSTESQKILRERIRTGEQQLMEVRSHDGGWNYGSPGVLGLDLPSYPETTALALVGLQNTKGLENAFTLASTMMQSTPSPLGRAWLTIAMRLHGMTMGEQAGNPSRDLMITSVEALSAADGNWKLMQAGGAA